MNDREFLTENQFTANKINSDSGSPYSDLDFSAFDTDNYQDTPEIHSAPVSESSFNLFSSDVEAPEFVSQDESFGVSPDFFNQDGIALSLDSEGLFHDETDSELGGTEATGVSHGKFAGDSIISQEEINSLIDNVEKNKELEVDRNGRIRSASADSGLHGTEATGVSPGDFAGDSIASQQEINSLIDDVVNNRELEVYGDGVIRNASANSGLHGTEATGVSQGDFADISSVSKEEIEELIRAIEKDDCIYVTDDGRVVVDPSENDLQDTSARQIPNGLFASGSIVDQDETDSYIDNNEGVILDRNGVVYEGNSLYGMQGTAITRVSAGNFAAQWYEKNPQLYRGEQKLMKRRFPYAKELKLQNGNMAWQIKMSISQTDAFDPWTFLLVYMPNHPNNEGFGGSIKVIPLVPNLEQLQKRVTASKGRYFSSTPPVPHVVIENKTRYLCTRDSGDIEDGKTHITSAAQTAAWAAEWALYFELSMLDNRVWNKWVDDEHFRQWKIIE